MSAIAGVAAQIISEDPALRDRVKAIVDRILAETEYMIGWGTPEQKSSLVKSFMPGMIRALQTAEQSSTATAQRESYEQHRREVRNALGTSHIGMDTNKSHRGITVGIKEQL